MTVKPDEFRSRIWAPRTGRVGLGGGIGATALIFAVRAPEVGPYFWGLAGLCAVIAVWCGCFNVLVTVSGGMLKISAGGIRILRSPVTGIDRVAPIVDLKNDWITRHLFGLYTVFDGRVQAVAGLPMVQINAGRRSVAVSIRDGERLAQVVQEGGADLDGKEAVGVRSHTI